MREAGRQVNTSLKRVESTKKARELAEQTLQAEEKRLAVGLSDTFRVLQAQRDLARQRVNELNALAGFEKSGHFFFNKPIGRGYDDGILTGIAVCEMLDRNPGKSMADLYRALPKTWGTPTMAPHCPDEVKYQVVERVVKRITAMREKGDKIAGQPIRDLVTVNGVRVTVEDGSWGLVRASSNKPELVVVVESMRSEDDMRALFREEVKPRLARYEEVGAYNQEI